MTIERLSDIVISQIAAGEVIERPASVVKELIENALDAEASAIQISILEGGKRLIRVSDNGTGIPADQVELALTRHATSKLRTADDLNRLLTLGFRGEALSSIAAVSRVTLTTRHRDEQIGTEIQLEGGALIRQQPIGAPTGTVLSVESLFFNTPARLRFMKKEATEKRYINTIITRYAMAYPDVRFVCEQDRREVLHTVGRGQLADVVVKVIGVDAFKKMVEVNALEESRNQMPSVRISGYTSLPSLTRGDRTQIALFVNGRWIQDSKLTYAIIQAYSGLIPTERYPIAILMIEVSTDEVDVNVHPTKAEVRFRQPERIFAALQRGVREAITQGNFDQRRFEHVRSSYTIETTAHDSWNSHIQLDLDLQATTGEASSEHEGRFSASETDLQNPNGPKKPRTLPPLRVVGQVGAMYIVAEGPAGMYLIDQNAAHARILYETVLERLQDEHAQVHDIPNSETVELSPDAAHNLERNLPLLNKLGLRLETFGPTTLIVRGVPQELADKTHQLQSLIQSIADVVFEAQPEIGEAIAATIAHQIALKAGQILSSEQMTTMIRQLERCKQPHTAPDGRTILIHLSGDQLAREFGRG